MKRVYLAGPDVFFPNAAQHFETLEALCAQHGLQGVRPSDGGLAGTAKYTPAQQAKLIYEANVALIRSCDAVLANLQPFRNGLEPDSGTAFEVGYAAALNKPVVGLVPSLRPQEERVLSECGLSYRTPEGQGFDARFGMLIEEFGQPLNLMLACSSSLHEDVNAALADLARQLAA